MDGGREFPLVSCYLYFIWFLRNDKVHGKGKDLSFYIGKLNNSVEEFCSLKAFAEIGLCKQRDPSVEFWTYALKGWLKVKTNASFKEGIAVLVVVVRVSSWKLVFLVTIHTMSGSALKAEIQCIS